MKNIYYQTLIQEDGCSGSCLPITMEHAKKHHKSIAPLIRRFPKQWSFNDKVLVLLLPDAMAKNVINFYQSNGSELASIFQDHQLERIDRDLVKLLDILIEKS